MSDSPDHLDPKEATEARLCAYLEGELAPADRAEIERHLLANPQHRQLLADLAKTREWMRGIPRENSPVDLGELFQGQMERSMLLDGDDRAKSSMGRWPQYALIAAILVLTFGLGVTLFEMLSGTGGRNKNLSLSPTTAVVPTSQTVDSPVAAKVDDRKFASLALKQSSTESVAINKDAAIVMPLAHGLGDVAAAKSADVSPALNRAINNNNSTFGMAKALDPLTADSVNARLQAAGYHHLSDRKTVGFVIAADAPTDADTQVKTFFNRHSLTFEPVLVNPALPTVIPATQQVAQNARPSTAAIQLQNQALNYVNPVVQNATAAPLANGPQIAPPFNETIYAAHNLTPLQVELLNASLSTDNLNQTVKRLQLAGGEITTKSEKSPATPPATNPAGAITKGQTLTITVPQLVGPGIDKTNVVKVAEDGTINLPMIDPLPAAGALPSQLESKIAGKYREANLIPQATVTVAAAAIPTTNPTTAPATQPAASSQPTTQAAKDDTAVDVVVIIEKSNTAIPNSPR